MQTTAMDNKLELENKFIQLWNEGNSYDEIAEEIGVDIEQIRQWGADLIVANNDLFYKDKYVLKKSEDGKYVSSNGKEFPERVLFKLEESKKDKGYWAKLYFDLPKSTIQFRPFKRNKQITIICNGYYSDNEIQKTESIPFIQSGIGLLGIEQKFEFQIIKLQVLIENSIPRKGKLKDQFQNFPFALVQFAFQEFEGIKNVRIENLPSNYQWIFLTGENGFGKTTILRALAHSLNTEPIFYQNGNYKTRLAVEYRQTITNLAFIHLNNPYLRQFMRISQFAAYGPSRLMLQHPSTNNEISGKSDTLYSLFNSDGILLNVETELVYLFLERNTEKFEQIKNLLISIVPYLKDIEVKNREVFYIEKSVDGEAYNSVKFDELAAGYKSVIAMVGDIYLRLSKNQPDVKIKDLGGIVLIDELDVHLHPKWQRALPGLLSKAFPKVQFIASTHSPIPFLGAPKNAVFLKVDRTPEEGITCERIDIDVTNLTPNLILTSPIFRFDEIITDEAKNNISEVRTEDSYEELMNNKALRDRLLEFEKSKREFPDELFEQKVKTNNPTESK